MLYREADHKKHSALDHLLADPSYGIRHAVVLSNGTIEQSGRIQYLPICMSYLLKQNEQKSMIWKPDLEGIS